MYLLVIFLLINTNWCIAQYSDIIFDQFYSEHIDFKLIPLNIKNVKSIKAVYFEKKTGELMKTIGRSVLYRFSSVGTVISSLDISKNDQLNDSIYNHYDYLPNGDLRVHRIKTLKDFRATFYFYDALHNIIRIEHYYDKILNRNFEYPRFDRGLLIDFETIRYKDSPNQRKKIVYNSIGNPYLDIVTFTNTKGQLSEISKKFKVSSVVDQTKYFYNSQKVMDSILNFQSASPLKSSAIKLIYDSRKLLVAKKLYKVKKLVTNIEYIYSSTLNTLSSIIIQDLITNNLIIIRFEYTYFDKK